MSSFNDQVKLQQATWRKKALPEVTAWGTWKDRSYPHLLQIGSWLSNVWSPIRKELNQYLTTNGIQPHTARNHLNSSWVLCANLYFPFRSSAGKRLLTSFLKANVCGEVLEITGVELEYEAPGELAPSRLLGESGGARGKGQTSPDVAFVFNTVNSGSGIILAECKFAEHWFYDCSAFNPKKGHSRPANHDATRCLNIEQLLTSPHTACHQHSVGWNRKYWDHLKPDASELRKLDRCPAAGHGYQLLRQQALAEGFASSGSYECVVSCVAYDSNNKPLIQSLKRLGIANFREGWGKLFNGKAKFSTFTHQQWAQWVRENGSGNEFRDWLSYVHTRYGY